jgi:DNA-binding GntR family transcriptional regulator
VSTENGSSIVERLAGEIADAIMVGEFPLGSRLRQEQLARRFGVSRQPVREALSRLAVIGMVEAVPRRGALVTGPEPGYIRDGYLIRAELEGLATRLAAARMDPARVAELRGTFEAFRREITEEVRDGPASRPTRAWVGHHNRFHELIHEASGIERLAQLIRALNVSLPRNLTTDALGHGDDLVENIRQHELILTAIELHAPEAAGEAMREHVLRSGELIARWFERRRDAGAPGTEVSPARRRARPTR